MLDRFAAVQASAVQDPSVACDYDRLKPGPGLPRDAVKSHQRARIQRAVVELLGRGDGKPVTVRSLAKTARISTATFYKQYDNIDECLVRTYVALMGAVRERIRASRDPFVGRRRQSELSVRALLGALLNDPAVGRFALIEIYGAGPAAIPTIRAQETLLEGELRAALDRRLRQVSSSNVAWVVAGLLHCMRGLLAANAGAAPSCVPSALLSWAQSCIDAAESESVPAARTALAAAKRPADRSALVEPFRDRRDETDLILSSVVKLARAEGYWTLSESAASQAAGVPATHFRRHFASLDEAYLEGVERLARTFFAGFGRRAGGRRGWRIRLSREIEALTSSLATDPATAGLVFSGVLAPGLGGLTRREALLDDLASTWLSSIPAEDRPPEHFARASIAALWSSIARAVESGEAECMPAAAPTLASFALSPAFDFAEGS